MKILAAHFKKGFAKISIETPEDLWYLSTIIQTGDIIKGSTLRKIKIGSEEKSSVIRKKVFLSLIVTELTFSPHTPALRITGTILEAPEDIPHGSHHTIQAEINDTLTIQKEQWLSFHIEKLKEASEVKPPAILLTIFDREEAHFAQMTRHGYKLLSRIKGDVAKKRKEHHATGDFYHHIITLLRTYDERFKLDKIILASPSFWKEELLKQLSNTDPLRKKLILATCSTVDETAFHEVLQRDETREALHQDRISKELTIIDQLLAEIARQGAITYGIRHVIQAADAGAVRTLIITDTFITSSREEKNYQPIEKLLHTVDAMKGTITIIHGDHAGGKKLDGLGGVAAFLRYKLA